MKKKKNKEKNLPKQKWKKKKTKEKKGQFFQLLSFYFSNLFLCRLWESLVRLIVTDKSVPSSDFLCGYIDNILEDDDDNKSDDLLPYVFFDRKEKKN